MTLQRCACSWRKEGTLQVLVSGVRELWTAELCCTPTIWIGMIFVMEEYLAQKTGLPIAVGNDANVAALGEALAGSR